LDRKQPEGERRRFVNGERVNILPRKIMKIMSEGKNTSKM